MWLIALLLILVFVMPAAYKSKVAGIQNINQGVQWIDDFFGVGSTLSSGYVSQFFRGDSAGGGYVASDGGLYSGQVTLFVQSNGDTAALYTASVVTTDTASIDYQIRCKFDALYTTTQMVTRIGLQHIPSAPSSSGVYFKYDRSVSNNWIACHNNGVLTSTVTTVPVSTSDTYLRIVVNSTRALYYINNVLVATIVKSIPTDTQIPTVYMESTLTDQSVTLYVDAIAFSQKFNTPRQFII
jgi:hypothetical protein